MILAKRTRSLPPLVRDSRPSACPMVKCPSAPLGFTRTAASPRSEEHTSELQSQSNLVCRLLLEKKKKNQPPRVCDPSNRGQRALVHARELRDIAHVLA